MQISLVQEKCGLETDLNFKRMLFLKFLLSCAFIKSSDRVLKCCHGLIDIIVLDAGDFL